MSTEISSKELKKLLGIARQEAGKFGKLGADERFMVVNLNKVDSDGEIDLPKKVILSVAENFRERAPHTGVMLVSVGPTKANIIVNLPESRNEITVEEWVNSLGVSDSCGKIIVLDKIYIFQTFNIEEKRKIDWSSNSKESHVVTELEEGEFLKYRDEIISKAFSFLSSKNLLPDEESDEEIYSLDD